MEKVSKLIDIKFVYGNNDKYIKIKTQICKDKVNTNFQAKKVPKENA